MALHSRQYVALRHIEYEQLCRAAQRTPHDATRVVMSRSVYRALLQAVDGRREIATSLVDGERTLDSSAAPSRSVASSRARRRSSSRSYEAERS